jgi:hypothetical protein
MIDLPNITPSSRVFTAPIWPVSGNKSQSGVTFYRLWGSIPNSATLTLSYNNILDTIAAEFLTAYNSAKGPITVVNLRPNAFAGLSQALINQYDLGSSNSGIKWYFRSDSPPRISSIQPGISNVDITLIGEVRRS